MVIHIDDELTLFPVAGYVALAVESAFRSKSEISGMWRSESDSLDTPLAFFIRIWEGSMVLKVSWEIFTAADEPKMPIEIR
jgi:hypothetical protein